jgi:CBS domain-containing protein
MVLFARDIVEKDFLVMPRGTTVLQAAKAMKDNRHGFVVIGSRSRPEGIVTEWDVLAKVVAEGRDPAAVKLEDIMSTELVSVRAEDGIAAVSQIMSSKGVRRVLVMKGDEVIGVITSKTVLAHLKDYVDKVSAQISRLQAPWF